MVIWVHTRSHTWVSLTLAPGGKGRSVQIKRQTGSRGWAHVRYRVVRVTPAHAIAVQATTRIGRSTYQAKGSILVR